MAICKQVEWTGSKFTGYIDIDTQLESDRFPKVKALVFMLVCQNDNWKIPVGYFFLDGLTRANKTELVKKCSTCVHVPGIFITSITCDASHVNSTMSSHLGAKFSDVNNLKSSFKHLISEKDIFIFLDPSPWWN